MAAWKYALLSICLMQAATSVLGDPDRKLLQAPVPAPEVAPPGACLGDFSFDALPSGTINTLLSPCLVNGNPTSGKDCCENIQFIGLALLALNSQLNSNIYTITSDVPAGQNAACVNDFNTNVLQNHGVNLQTSVVDFCAAYSVEVFPNIEATLQGSSCPTFDLAGVQNIVDLNALAGACYGPNSCLPAGDSGLTTCEDAVVAGARSLAVDAQNAGLVAACAEVVSARLVQTHFYESYYSIIQDCGNGTANTALPPSLEFAQSPTNTFSLPPLPPRPPTPAPAPAPKNQSPVPAPGPHQGPNPAPAPGSFPPPSIVSPPPPPGAAASTTANVGLFFGIVLLVASIL